MVVSVILVFLVSSCVVRGCIVVVGGVSFCFCVALCCVRFVHVVRAVVAVGV